MSVEFPLALIDTLIRRNAGNLRVSEGAAEELARHLQDQGVALGKKAARQAESEGRNTIMAKDTDVDEIPRKEELVLPIAPVDRVVRLDLADYLRVARDARIAFTHRLENHADEVARSAALLARHAGRRTIQSEDISTYVKVANGI